MPIKGGNVFVDAIDVPDGPVEPGAPITVDVTVANGALSIRSGDDDNCANAANRCAPPGFLETTGYCVGVSVALGGFTNEEVQCIQLAFAGVNRRTYSFELLAPSAAGEHDVEVGLFGDGSGESEVLTRTLSVEAPAGGGNGDGDGGNGGEPVGDAPLGLTRTQALALGGGALVLLGAVAATAGDDG